ncbi:MAG: hypothetical protein AAF153_03295, partial [Pseudomonadota bacterium]
MRVYASTSRAPSPAAQSRSYGLLSAFGLENNLITALYLGFTNALAGLVIFHCYLQHSNKSQLWHSIPKNQLYAIIAMGAILLISPLWHRASGVMGVLWSILVIIIGYHPHLPELSKKRLALTLVQLIPFTICLLVITIAKPHQVLIGITALGVMTYYAIGANFAKIIGMALLMIIASTVITNDLKASIELAKLGNHHISFAQVLSQQVWSGILVLMTLPFIALSLRNKIIYEHQDKDQELPKLKIIDNPELNGRKLVNDNIVHSMVKIDPDLPVMCFSDYYDHDGPWGQLIKITKNYQNWLVVGLGCGSILDFIPSGSKVDFIEFDQRVISLANDINYFTKIS